MSKIKYALIDFETTGLDFQVSSPIEIGIVWLDEKFRYVNAYQALIDTFFI